MPKKAWFFKNKTLLGILGVMLVFGTLATGCPTDGGETEPTTPTSYTVRFDTDGGSAVPDQKVEEGKKVTKPANPTKVGYTFVAWYKDSAKTIQWNFDTDTVTANITLYAKWRQGENVQLFTVTFNADGGTPAPAEQRVAQDEKVARPANPTKTGYTFAGWYKDSAQTTPWTFDTDTVTANITLYAKWTSPSELAQYAGVWRSSSDAYLLQADGKAWRFYSIGTFIRYRWSPSQISAYAITFNEAKTQFTLTTSNTTTTYTKNTSETKTPAAATGSLLGIWVSSSFNSLELKSDKTAVLTYYNVTITLGYCVQSNKLYLLAPTSNLVIVSIDITNSKPNDFSKPTSDNALAGIWKLTDEGQDYYWDLKADGSGTFHTLGASVPVSFTVTEDKEIGGELYTISGDTLTFPYAGEWDEETNKWVDLALTKVTSVPSGSGAGGDSNLHGSWKITQGNDSMTITFNSNGTLSEEQRLDDLVDSQSSIWKADGSNIYVYSSSYFDSVGSSPTPYTVSGSTLTIGSGNNSMVFTKQ